MTKFICNRNFLLSIFNGYLTTKTLKAANSYSWVNSGFLASLSNLSPWSQTPAFKSLKKKGSSIIWLQIEHNSYLSMWSRIKSLGPGGIFTSLRALKHTTRNQRSYTPRHDKQKNMKKQNWHDDWTSYLSVSKGKVLSVNKPLLKFFS